jgi:hypothetical protein
MRAFLAAAAIVLWAIPVAKPALAQDDHVQRYGEKAKEKSQVEIQAEKEADRAYKRSLGNIPDKGPSDPWGGVRSDAPKTTTSTTTAKSAKTKTGAAN